MTPQVGEEWRHKRLPESPARCVRTGRQMHTDRPMVTLRWSNGVEETVLLGRAFAATWEKVP